MPLLKDGQLAKDKWTFVEDSEALPDCGAVVSLKRWREDRDQLKGRNAPVGIRLEPGEAPDAIKDDLGFFGVVALNFPKFSDGRAYSYARLLRDRYGFKGEVRAIGHVLRDQFRLMHRCGFDAAEVASDKDAAAWPEAIRTFSHAYQPATEGPETVMALRARQQAA